ncbi:MAG: hypothetical protein IPG39_12615 [Bacteroidetes bacterium]|nr:hypothetical protein [Bacteroidota bacterium]
MILKDTANIITGTSIVRNPKEVAPQLVIQPGIYYSILVYDLSIQISGTDPIKVYGKNNQVILNGDSI